MHAGLMEVTLRLEGNASLKGKRKVVKSILGRVKARFNAWAARIFMKPPFWVLPSAGRTAVF